MIVQHIFHNGNHWHIIKNHNSYFARFGTSDTGPYSTAEQAEEFIRAIRP